jgi:hypothetical protein
MTTYVLGIQVPFEDLVGYTLNLEGELLVATRPNSEKLYFCSSETTDPQHGCEIVRNIFLGTRPKGPCSVQGNFDELRGKIVASVEKGDYGTCEAKTQDRPVSVILEVENDNRRETYMIRPNKDCGIEYF